MNRSSSIANVLHDAAAALASASDTPELDARLLLQHAMNVPHEYLIAHGNEPLAPEALEQFHAMLARRCAHEPLAYIIGYKEFWRDRFFVTPDTLIPRPDSETMIEVALTHFPEKNAPLRVLDMGTGSGCLLLSTLREYENATGVGIDISAPALGVAQKNAQAIGLGERVSFLQSDWASALPESEIFDLICCNPPYISAEEMKTLAPNVLQYEPHGALTDFADGLKMYRALFECLPKHMHASSIILFEVGSTQADMVAELAKEMNTQTIRIEHDIAGVARIVSVGCTNQKK